MNWKLESNVKITVKNIHGEILETKEFHNLITTVGLNMVRDLWEGLIADGELKYVGVGDDNTAPTTADVWLGNETFRKILTSSSEPGDGQLKTIVYIDPSEAIGTIEEIGWFSGAGAGAGANTGIMISRVLYSRIKTALESIQIERTDTIAEA